MSRRLPAALTPGDRIAIVSPASAFARDEFDAGVAELRRLGFVPVYDETVFAREAGYLAGTPELRAGAFLRFWRDPSVARADRRARRIRQRPAAAVSRS